MNFLIFSGGFKHSGGPQPLAARQQGAQLAQSTCWRAATAEASCSPHENVSVHRSECSVRLAGTGLDSVVSGFEGACPMLQGGASPQRGGISSYIVVTHQHSTIRRSVDRYITLISHV